MTPDLTDADLEGADLRGATYPGGILVANTDLSRTNLANLKWSGIRDLNARMVFAVKMHRTALSLRLKHGASGRW